MKRTYCAIAIAAMLSACGGTLPPIQVKFEPPAIGAGATTDAQPAAKKPRATLAFVVTDEEFDTPIGTAWASFDAGGKNTGPTKQANDQGYIAQELDAGGAVYTVTFTADGYATKSMSFQMGEKPDEAAGAGNRQFIIKLRKKDSAAPPASGPLRDLLIHVTTIESSSPGTARSRPIPNAWCTIDGDKRIADGAGFLHFPITGRVAAECGAANFQTRTVALEPGERGVELFASLPLPKPPTTPPAGAIANCAGAAFDGLSCARNVAAKYPQLLETNTFVSCLEFTQRVLEALGDPWGHVGKSQSEGQSVPRGFAPFDYRAPDGVTYRITGVSHDAIKHRITGQVIDLLSNATANEPCDPATLPPGDNKCWEPGPASVQWGNVPQFSADGKLQWRPSNPFVPAVPVQ